ncbi:MAG: pentapeptide repeat-containing protein [Leptolyngbyaceae cyanobacterium]
MAERGKYHGQRLKARDVLRLYAAGENDFRSTILRGCNFRGADLSGADFSRADIRSARFVNVILRGTTFSYAQAGLQRCWLWTKLALACIFSTLSIYLQAMAGALMGITIANPLDSYEVYAGVGGLVVVAIVFGVVVRQGYTLKTPENSAAVIVIVAVVVFTSANSFNVSFTFASTASFTVMFAIVVAFSIVAAGAGTCVNSIAFAFSPIAAFTSFCIGTLAATGTILRNIAYVHSTSAAAVSTICAGAVVFTGFLSSVLIGRRILEGNPNFENLRIVSCALGALGGTAFSGTDLTRSTFVQANLKNTNFANSRQHHTILTNVRWHQAEKLDRARLGTSNLQDPRVRNLLTTLNGIDQDLFNADLQGANLASAQLHRVNLKGANLSGATLQKAELHEANLTKTQCVGTDFTDAHLTGACLEAWNIDETTVLKDIDCQYVFLKEDTNALGVRERLPHNPDKCFEPGDFEKYFREVLDEVKILIRGGVDPQAFKVAFQELMRKHQITPQAVRSIQRKGPDVLMSVAASPDQAKPDIARTFDIAYEKALPTATAQALLEAERRHKQEFVDFADKSIDRISRVLSNLTIQSTAMTNSNNPNITTGDGSFYAGGDVTLSGSTLNLGEISGKVSNQISQLPDTAPNADQPSLKDLLAQLKTAIDQDTELSDDEKAEALGEVAKLVKAGSNPTEGAMQRLAQRATNTLKAIAETLTDASKLVTACKTLLPAIAALF